jgi:hypothetical protein
MSPLLLGLATLGSLLASAPAEPFAIDLKVRAGKASKTAPTESTAPGVKPKERGVLEVKAGDRITVKWKLSSTDAKATLKNITVHFFAVKEERVGQQIVPALNKGVVAESALGMDFSPQVKNEGTLRFTIDEPGCYLFRLETIGATAGPVGHENFAALDVRVH